MKTHIVILGGGFGGLYTALELEKRLGADSGVEITLVNRDNFFLFTPMLHEVAASDLDASFWIDCSFETALERALARGQERLPPDETIKAYRTIYFPAQEIHCLRDRPRAAASRIINNDPKLLASPED